MAEVNLLNTEITYLKGVGPKRAEIYANEFGINTFEDLLNYFPFRYIDKSLYNFVSDIQSLDSYYQIKGKIAEVEKSGKGKQSRISAIFVDEKGQRIKLKWFQGVSWIEDKIIVNKEYIIYGKPTFFGNQFTFNHPEVNPIETTDLLPKGLFPIYHSGEKATDFGLNSKGIAKNIFTLIERIYSSIPENLSSEIINKYKLLSRQDAYRQIHFPETINLKEKAIARFKFEEFFFIQLSVIKIKLNRKSKIHGHNFVKIGPIFNDFYTKNLPFELTTAQKRVIKEIRRDMGSNFQMNRLLQGDVGSGKTLVAILSMLIAIDNSYQTALMAPTEILAKQHYKTITNLLDGLPVNIAILTGSSNTAERKEIHNNLRNGKLNIIIGTHALIEDTVVFHNLGLVIIDEQHRFGVAQRARLWQKNKIPPDILVMTATPIPRTMAMTLYGDLDYSVIDELPKGRKSIQTFHFNETKRLKVFAFMKKIISQGQQVYVVFPLIEESESLDLKNLMEGYEAISRDFPLPEYKISIVHGRMDPSAKEIEMQRFAKGITNILVSTTVIEVGVDVPNASLMVIENANRFGLSQLHQLRGRVGRGAEQSYCILMSEGNLTQIAKHRLKTMVETNDGFKIANMDLKLRGPGELEGTKQSGLLNLRIADIATDERILKAARITAENLLSEDPQLNQESNYPIKKYLLDQKQSQFDWSKIS
jgi:ATP-dependent DNA helicase RecG